MKVTNQTTAILSIIMIMTTACTKLVNIPESKSQVESSIVFADESLANAALLGAYHTLGTVNTRMKHLSLYSDEYNYTSISDYIRQFRDGKLLADNSDVSTLWRDLFSVIYQTNAIIEGVGNSQGISPPKEISLKAEAKFLRAYSNFYLVNIYGNIPLIVSTDVNKNRSIMQSKDKLIYDQIVKDLLEAKSELGSDYEGVGKVRANKWAASALLSRVYLYQGNWEKAEKEATEVINSNLYSPLPKLSDVFLANSRETILQLWTTGGFLTDASSIIPANPTSLPAYPITEQLYHAFDSTDGRKTKWISTNNVTVSGVTNSYTYFAKYKNRQANLGNSEYIMVLRLSELYMICAESQAHLQKFEAATANLNVIRARATGILPLTKLSSEEECLIAVAKERRLEFFGEWGHRFFDLKRYHLLDATLGPVKSAWRTDAGLFPIPASDIISNPNLIQNHGY